MNPDRIPSVVVAPLEASEASITLFHAARNHDVPTVGDPEPSLAEQRRHAVGDHPAGRPER